MERRLTLRTAGGLLVTVGLALTALSLPGSANAETYTWPQGFGPCYDDGHGKCPPEGYFTPPEKMTSDSGYRDAAVSLFVGGDLLVRNASEIEGISVIGGDLTIDSGKSFNMAVAVGSQIRPPEGSVGLVVGGDLTVKNGWSLLLGGSVSGEVGGAIDGKVDPDGIVKTAKPNPFEPYRQAGAELRAISHGIATLPSNAAGIAHLEPVSSGSTMSFLGDKTSPFQVFDLTPELAGKLATATTTAQFKDIPNDATIIVNFPPGDATLKVQRYNADSRAIDRLQERTIWNFPDSENVLVTGNAQLPGMILVGSPTSKTTVNVTNTNGRVYVAGDLTHTYREYEGGDGQEMHAYPFRAQLPSFADPGPDETPGPDPSGTPDPDASQTPDPSGTPDPDASQTPDPSGTPDPDASQTPDPSETPEPDASQTPDPSGTPDPDWSQTPEPKPSGTTEPRTPTSTPTVQPSTGVKPAPSEPPSPVPVPSPSKTTLNPPVPRPHETTAPSRSPAPVAEPDLDLDDDMVAYEPEPTAASVTLVRPSLAESGAGGTVGWLLPFSLTLVGLGVLALAASVRRPT